MTTADHRAELELRSALSSAAALGAFMRRIYAAAHGLADVRSIGDRLIVYEKLVETVAALYAGALPHITCPGEYADDGRWTPCVSGCATCRGAPMLDVLRETVALRALVGEMRAVLVGVEWAGPKCDGVFGWLATCPACGSAGIHVPVFGKPEHRLVNGERCPLAAALTKSAGYAKETT